MHFHDKYRITAVTSGRGTLATEQGVFRLRPGDILLLAAGVRHRVSHHGAPLGLLVVEFVPSAVLTAAEHPLLAGVYGGRPVLHCPLAAATEATSLMHRIRAEQRRGFVAGTVAIRAYLMALLVLLFRRRKGGDGALVFEPLLGEVKASMEANFAQPLHLADLAAQAHLSVRQFTARFKRAFGETPLRYVTRLRMAAAAELLCRSGKGVAEIARDVGYENLSHFYRTFGHHTGMSPGRYRQAPPAVGPAVAQQQSRGRGAPG